MADPILDRDALRRWLARLADETARRIAVAEELERSAALLLRDVNARIGAPAAPDKALAASTHRRPRDPARPLDNQGVPPVWG
jgi:hypothetical protein